ncbi:MAG TPA: thioredoxin-like domain-containing protein [bacterium]|jgi:thiol-disulfide isomerase/thioredoxin|nr:thioredoxin-like domain-containing protein [bacterium]
MKTKLTWILTALLLCNGLNSSALAQTDFPEIKQGAPMSLHPDLQGTVNAPEFPSGAEWLNTDHPVSMKDLKRKIVLLDFWTFCCINCMHVIPDLKRLEEKYPTQLVVIGVHSAKFNSEKDSENIRNAILRYEIHHPVINDKNFTVWSSYGIRAWPSFALIDPNGKVVGITSGEGVYETLEPYIDELAKHYEAEGKLNLKPFTYNLEKDKKPAMPLSFPGKINADEKSDTLVISDSDHNRVVLTTLDGKVKEVIGGKEQGFKDGGFHEARFFRPQGVYFDAENKIIYVADTENHAIREIDLVQKKVKTLAGTGRQALKHNVEGLGKNVDLNSPWDLIKIGGKLYVAMAGSHQIWTLNLKSLEAKIYAGSGHENIADEDNSKQAALAQTSGITTDGQQLYFVDSETSSLRQAGLPPAGGVSTFIGSGLFDFGDKDGPAKQAMLQHPIGIAFHDGLIYVADTYNNKIKAFNPQTGVISTILGGPKAGHQDGAASQTLLNEPCGLAFAGEKLYIADTNNNLIRVFDQKSGQLSTLNITGLEKLHPMKADAYRGQKVNLPAQTINTQAKELRLEITLPADRQFNEQAPSRYEISSSNTSVASLVSASGDLKTTSLSIPLTLQSGQTELSLTLHVFYCSHGKEALCYFKEVQLHIPITVSENGESVFKVHYTIHS